MVSQESGGLFQAGDPAVHVLEAGAVRLVIGDDPEGGGGTGDLQDSPGEAKDGDFLVVPQVDDLSPGLGMPWDVQEGPHDVGDVGEAPGLCAVPVDRDGFSPEGLLHQVGDDHAILAGLAGAHGVEEAHDRHGEAVFHPVCQGEELIQGLGAGIAPAPGAGGAHDGVVFLAEGDAGAFSVDLGGAGEEEGGAVAVAGVQHHGGAPHDTLNGAHRLVDDEAHPHRAGQVVDIVGPGDQLLHQGGVVDGAHVEGEGAPPPKPLQVHQGAGGEVVQDVHLVSLRQQGLTEM